MVDTADQRLWYHPAAIGVSPGLVGLDGPDGRDLDVRDGPRFSGDPAWLRQCQV